MILEICVDESRPPRYPEMPAVLGVDLKQSLSPGVYRGIRRPRWVNEGRGSHYEIDSHGTIILIPTILISGYNHCTPGYKVTVTFNPLEKVVAFLEKLIWQKLIWEFRNSEERYESRCRSYYRQFYFQTNPYYRKCFLREILDR